MPEIPLCEHCYKPIDKAKDDYVVTNKDTAKSESQFLLAHLKCHQEEMGSKID